MAEQRKLTIEELENQIDLRDLFIGIWAAVEYGGDQKQHKQKILELINRNIKEKS